MTMTGSDETAASLVSIRDLSVHLPLDARREIHAVRSVSLEVRPGERVGIVGESGSGKSVSARALAGLLPGSRRTRIAGSIRFDGEELTTASARRWSRLRQTQVGMIFQDPASYLNPTMRVGRQVREAVLRGNAADKGPTGHLRYMEMAGLPRAEEVALKYPFELSGGMRQRVLIAIALAKEPQLIIADEPTTALDATVQRHVLRSLDDSVRELGTSLLLITHDLGVVAGVCDRVYVMYAGEVLEHGTTEDIFYRPQHPYTQELLACVRSLDDDGPGFHVSTYGGQR